MLAENTESDVTGSVRPAKYGKVRPRRRKTNADLPIITVVLDEGFCLEDGQIGDIEEFIVRFREFEHSIIVGYGIAELCSLLKEYHPELQAVVTASRRQHWSAAAEARNQQRAANGKGPHHAYKNMTLIHRMGFTHGRHTTHKGNRRIKQKLHLCLDPMTFQDRAIQDYVHNDHISLRQWAVEIRSFCQEELLDIKATAGAIGRQYLRDPRFYPTDRRKVHISTNEKLRPFLGNNHYEVRIAPRCIETKEYAGRYLDQHAAHHYQTEQSQLPSSNDTKCYGAFRGNQKIWKTDPLRIHRFLREFKGAFIADIRFTPKRLQWVPDELRRQNLSRILLCTTELDLLYSLGAKVTAIYCAWGSYTVDTGLPRFATHAQALIEIHGEKGWLKQLLLATYGCLATRPRKVQFGYLLSGSGTPTKLPAGKRTLTVRLHETNRNIEPSTNNVLQRLMIERATRCESLMYANRLQQQGYRVLAIYVDAVIVEFDGRKPPTLPPWTQKKALTHLRFIRKNAFVSYEMTKVPGGLTSAEMRAANKHISKNTNRKVIRGEVRPIHWRRAKRRPVVLNSSSNPSDRP